MNGHWAVHCSCCLVSLSLDSSRCSSWFHFASMSFSSRLESTISLERAHLSSFDCHIAPTPIKSHTCPAFSIPFASTTIHLNHHNSIIFYTCCTPTSILPALRTKAVPTFQPQNPAWRGQPRAIHESANTDRSGVSKFVHFSTAEHLSIDATSIHFQQSHKHYWNYDSHASFPLARHVDYSFVLSVVVVPSHIVFTSLAMHHAPRTSRSHDPRIRHPHSYLHSLRAHSYHDVTPLIHPLTFHAPILA